jgi:hypothetical protein
VYLSRLIKDSENLCVAVCRGTYSTPMVMWTQQSSLWSKLSGIFGEPSSYLQSSATVLNGIQSLPAPSQLVQTRPSSTLTYSALDFDSRRGAIYWSATSSTGGGSGAGAIPPQGSLSFQPLSDALHWKNESIRSFGPVDWVINSLAVDWQTANVYVGADAGYQLIGVVRYDVTGSTTSANRLYRILFSSGLTNVTAVGLDPDSGLVNELNYKFIPRLYNLCNVVF